MSAGGKGLIMTRHNLTSAQERELEQQREDAVHRKDGVIEEFEGYRWDILGAFGKNVTRKRGERDCSFIQVLTAHPALGRADGPRSVLPPSLFKKRSGEYVAHDYYDMRARREDGALSMFYFFIDGKWGCYIGRVLNDSEISQMQGV